MVPTKKSTHALGCSETVPTSEQFSALARYANVSGPYGLTAVKQSRLNEWREPVSSRERGACGGERGSTMNADDPGGEGIKSSVRASDVRAVSFVSVDVIAKTADEIREYHRFCGLRDADAIGRTILARFFEGRPELWRSHRPDKDASLRKLAEHLRGTITRSGLRRCVRIHLVALEHPSVTQSAHLTSSHADEVYGLSRDQRELLLTIADRERWNVAALREAKRRMMREPIDCARPARGRPASPPELKAVTRLENAFAATRSAESLLSDVETLHPEARRELLDAAKSLESCAERVVRRIEAAQARPLWAREEAPDRVLKGSVDPAQSLPTRVAG